MAFVAVTLRRDVARVAESVSRANHAATRARFAIQATSRRSVTATKEAIFRSSDDWSVDDCGARAHLPIEICLKASIRSSRMTCEIARNTWSRFRLRSRLSALRSFWHFPAIFVSGVRYSAHING